MGEYMRYKGQRIKVGTCEDLMYLRPDQIGLVEYDGDCSLRDLTHFVFRFPFPDEDHKEPGDFEPDRGWPFYGLEPPEQDELHHDIQFGSNGGLGGSKGVLVMLPCPFSAKGKATGLKYMFNGFGGPLKVVGQRAWAGVWATVMACGACGGKYRMPELDDALEVLDTLIKEGDRRGDHYGDRKRYHEIATRIRRGYQTPIPEGRQ